MIITTKQARIIKGNMQTLSGSGFWFAKLLVTPTMRPVMPRKFVLASR